MKVLFITRKYPPSIGGMQLFARDVYVALSKKTDTELIKWGGSNKYLPIVLPYFLIRASWALLKGGIDVIHVHDGLLSPLGFVLSRIFRKPFTVEIHGLDLTYKNSLYQLVVPWAVKKADTIFCISKAAADEVIARGSSKDKIKVIPLAVNDTIYDPSKRQELRQRLALKPDAKILITVGRLVKRKGAAWFIENVLPTVVAKHPKTIYVVAGGGEEQENIEIAISKAEMQKHVRLLGKIDNEYIAAVYNGADVFVMPNLVVSGDIEGFGLVVLEAALCALPIVASALEGIKDAVTDGQNGILVETRDVAGFMHAIDEFLGDSKYAVSFGTKSREYTLKHHQWDTLAERYVAAYEAIRR